MDYCCCRLEMPAAYTPIKAGSVWPLSIYLCYASAPLPTAWASPLLRPFFYHCLLCCGGVGGWKRMGGNVSLPHVMVPCALSSLYFYLGGFVAAGDAQPAPFPPLLSCLPPPYGRAMRRRILLKRVSGGRTGQRMGGGHGAVCETSCGDLLLHAAARFTIRTQRSSYVIQTFWVRRPCGRFWRRRGRRRDDTAAGRRKISTGGGTTRCAAALPLHTAPPGATCCALRSLRRRWRRCFTVVTGRAFALVPSPRWTTTAGRRCSSCGGGRVPLGYVLLHAHSGISGSTFLQLASRGSSFLHASTFLLSLAFLPFYLSVAGGDFYHMPGPLVALPTP